MTDYRYTDPHEIKHPEVKQTYYREDDDRPGIKDGDEEYRFGYDTIRSSSEVTGELAQRIRKALGVDDDVDVMIEEETGDASYSEYTQEQYREFKIVAGSVEREFDYDAFNSMLKWLDAEAPV